MNSSRRALLAKFFFKTLFYNAVCLFAVVNFAAAASSFSLDELRFFAEKGDVESQYELGKKLIEMAYTPEDTHEGLKWTIKAAEQNNSSAQWLIGTMYRSGKGVGANQDRALSWFNRACKNGLDLACNDVKDFRSRLTAGAMPIPDLRKAAFDLYGLNSFESSGKKYRTGSDEITRFWIEEEFELQGRAYHSKFFVSHVLDSHTGRPYESHASGVRISAITYQKQPNGSWRIVSEQKNIGSIGSWGDVNSSYYEAEAFSSSSYGLLFDSGYSTQGESSSGKVVFVFSGNKWHDAGYISESEDNESSISCGSNARCHDFHGVSKILKENNKAFPDIYVERSGIGYDGKKPADDITYKHNGVAYVTEDEYNRSARINNSHTYVSSDSNNQDPTIEDMHRLLEESIPNANREIAGKHIDNVTRVKSVTYDRKIPAVIYTYYENPAVSSFFEQISGVPDGAAEAARKMFADSACSGPYHSMMLLFDLKIIHDFEGVIKHIIRFEDCEG